MQSWSRSPPSPAWARYCHRRPAPARQPGSLPAPAAYVSSLPCGPVSPLLCLMLARAPKPTRILLVEDEPAFVEALRFQLQREGYDVRVAPDGATAIAAAQRIRPDLVLLDL